MGTVYWIDHFTVCTNDLDRFKEFHAQVLGGKQWPGFQGREIFQQVGPCKTGGFTLDRPLPPTRGLGAGLPRYGFFVDPADIGAHVRRLDAAGAVRGDPQRTTAYGEPGTALFWQDPDGNQFEFWAPDVMPDGAMANCGPERIGRISHGVFESRDLERTARFFDRYCITERLPADNVANDTLVLRLAAGARLVFLKVERLEGRTMGFGMPDPHTALVVRDEDFFPGYARIWAELPEWDYEYWATPGVPVSEPEKLTPRTFLHASREGYRFRELTKRGDGFLDWDTNFFHFYGGAPIDGSMSRYEGHAIDYFTAQWAERV